MDTAMHQLDRVITGKTIGRLRIAVDRAPGRWLVPQMALDVDIVPRQQLNRGACHYHHTVAVRMRRTWVVASVHREVKGTRLVATHAPVCCLDYEDRELPDCPRARANPSRAIISPETSPRPTSERPNATKIACPRSRDPTIAAATTIARA